MPLFGTLATKNNALIRKPLDVALWIAEEDATAVTAPVANDGTLASILSGYHLLGHMTDEGIQYTREIENSDITSVGRYQPTRSDKTLDITTIQATFQETNIYTLAVFHDTDWDTLTMDATTGLIELPKVTVSETRYYRLFAVGVDKIGADEAYMMKFFPRVKVTTYGDQAWSKGDTALEWNLTFQAYVDETLGYDEITYIGGAAIDGLRTDMGFA